jgi:hypothetical protein
VLLPIVATTLWESACTVWLPFGVVATPGIQVDCRGHCTPVLPLVVVIPVRASGDPLLVIAALALLCTPAAVHAVNNPRHLVVESAWVGC